MSDIRATLFVNPQLRQEPVQESSHSLILRDSKLQLMILSELNRKSTEKLTPAVQLFRKLQQLPPATQK